MTGFLPIITDNPIHSNNSINCTNLSNRRNFVAIIDKLHGRKERSLAFNKSEKKRHLQS